MANKYIGIKYINLKCDNCGKDFKRKLWEHSHHHTEKRNDKHVFCSYECRNKYRTKTNSTTLDCSNCGKPVTRKNSQVRHSKSGRIFCNKSCAMKHNIKLRKSYRRSKIEIKFYTLLVKEFPNLNILPNDKTMLDGSEVDVAIPELKLAIEWNGAVHFKPIYGQKGLDQTQKKDAEKLKIASNNDINLIVITDLVSNDEILQKSFEDCKKIINELLITTHN